MTSPIAPALSIPAPREAVAWSAAIRADIPVYVGEQLREATHQYRCTLTALLLRMIAEYRDPSGNRVFAVREEDLAADRRRIRR